MSDISFSSTSVRRVMVLRISGNAPNASFGPMFAEQLDNITASGCKHVMVDLELEGGFGGEFLGELVRQRMRLEKAGGRMAFFSHRTSFDRAFSQIKSFPAEAWRFFRTEAEALCFVLYGVHLLTPANWVASGDAANEPE